MVASKEVVKYSYQKTDTARVMIANVDAIDCSNFFMAGLMNNERYGLEENWHSAR